MHIVGWVSGLASFSVALLYSPQYFELANTALLLIWGKTQIRLRMSYLGVGVSPGNVPVSHSGSSSSSSTTVIDRRVRVVELVLRFLICGLGLAAALLVATDTQVKEIFTVKKKAKFTDMKALV